MESNSDKEMREKLQSTEFPFDPKAWEQMENMLDEKPGRKRFFWWWFTGVAASLFIAAIFGYHQFMANTPSTPVISGNNTAVPVSTNNLSNSNTPVIPSPVTNTPVGQTNNTTTAQQGLNTVGNNAPASSGQSQQASVNTPANQGLHANSKKPVKTVVASNQRPQYANNANRIIISDLKKIARNNRQGARHNKSMNEEMAQNQSTRLNQPSSHTNVLAALEEVNSLTNAQERPTLTDPAALDIKRGFELPETTENSVNPQMQEEKDASVRKLKRPVFNYSMGVMANVSGTTLGKQAGTSASDLFSHTPSYMVGFTNDFMFLKRFAITNSILVSQTSFKLFNPNTSYVSNYTSNITEMAIPIGVKGYAVSKPKFRFYLGAGIINHIKLKETFSYQYTYNNLMSPTGAILPAQTLFTPGTEPALFANSFSSSSYYTTSEYSLNQARRYYASFYANAGVEYIVKKHFVFFAEPQFDMALAKIGLQNKSKYNLGLNAGFRYQF